MSVKNNNKSGLKKVLRRIVLFLDGLVDKFMKIPKKWRLVILVWFIILLLLILFIIVGSSNKKHIQEYETIETKMVEATEGYLKEKELYPTQMKQLNLSLDALIDYANLDSKLFDGKTCIGYTKSYYSDEDEKYIVHPYLNCKGYTTEGYKDNK